MDNGNYCDKSEESQDNNVVPMTILFDNLSTNSPPELNLFADKERTECSKLFEKWPETEQTDFVQGLLTRMTHFQQSQINFYLSPMLQRDFISLLPQKGLDHVAEKILGYLDGVSLCNAELVCKQWHQVISERMLWKKLIEYNVKTNYLWRELSKRRGWANYLFKNGYMEQQRPDHWFYRRLYPQIIKDIKNMEKNWRNGRHTLQKINCRSEVSKGVYCLQYDDNQIISGLRDNTIKVWSRSDLQCKCVLTGHTGSVLCLQFDEKVIVSGSSDATVRVWCIQSGVLKSTLIHHSEAVLHLRFSNGLMVTCSKDRSIAVWDMNSPSDITLRRVLLGHRAAVNVVDFDDKYIVSASGDRTIKVWNTSNCEFVRTLMGHKRGIACLQYRDNLVVSGSSDNTIRLWNVEQGICIRVLEGHEELVRCIRFDDKRIVSGAYDGKIKVWDLEAALDTKKSHDFCLKTLVEHTGRVFRLQFDQFQIVSSSHDDTIIIWDFLDSEQGNFRLPAFRRGGNSNGHSSNGNSSSTNGNGAKSKHSNLNNGSTNGFASLSSNRSNCVDSNRTVQKESLALRTGGQSEERMDSSSLLNPNPFSSDANLATEPMQSSSIGNQLDQEMTNSSEFPAMIIGGQHHHLHNGSTATVEPSNSSSSSSSSSSASSSDENQQVGLEIMDTQKESSQLNSPSGSNQFNSYLYLLNNPQGSKSKLNNITNLTNSPAAVQPHFNLNASTNPAAGSELDELAINSAPSPFNSPNLLNPLSGGGVTTTTATNTPPEHQLSNSGSGLNNGFTKGIPLF